jgi:hypothetical protein
MWRTCGAVCRTCTCACTLGAARYCAEVGVAVQYCTEAGVAVQYCAEAGVAVQCCTHPPRGTYQSVQSRCFSWRV